jgi:hypothetical protein
MPMSWFPKLAQILAEVRPWSHYMAEPNITDVCLLRRAVVPRISALTSAHDSRYRPSLEGHLANAIRRYPTNVVSRGSLMNSGSAPGWTPWTSSSDGHEWSHPDGIGRAVRASQIRRMARQSDLDLVCVTVGTAPEPRI